MKDVIANIICFPLLLIILILTILAYILFLIAYHIAAVLVVPTGIKVDNMWMVNKIIIYLIDKLYYDGIVKNN